jgi:Family of unknown function (DUF5995)
MLALPTHIWVGAVDATGQSGDRAAGLVAARGATRRDGVEAAQFALAGINAHINHDLPLAMVSTCTALATSPTAGAHFAHWQNVTSCWTWLRAHPAVFESTPVPICLLLPLSGRSVPDLASDRLSLDPPVNQGCFRACQRERCPLSWDDGSC